MNSTNEDWTALLTNPRQINLYYSQAPDLSKVSIHEVSLNREGARLALRFELAEYPDNPPPKWVLNRFNRAQCTLQLYGVYAVTIDGWAHMLQGSLRLSKEESGIHLSFTDGQHSINGSGQFLVLEEISGYQVGDVAETDAKPTTFPGN
jgi:hypothetical protein